MVALSLACWLGTGSARSRLPQAGGFVSTLRVPVLHSVYLAAYQRSLFALDVPSLNKPSWQRLSTTVIRVNPDGQVARRRVRFGYFTYSLGTVAAGPFGFYVGTALVRRLAPPPFWHTPDELFRFDPKTLGIAARAYFPAGVSPFAAGRRLWASVGNGRVVRLDPLTLKIEASTTQIAFSPDHVSPPFLSTPALGFGSLWLLTGASLYLHLLRLDPTTLAVSSRTTLPIGWRNLVETWSPMPVTCTSSGTARPRLTDAGTYSRDRCA